MFWMSLYIFIGAAVAVWHDSTEYIYEDDTEETIYMIILLFITMLWPIYLIWKLVRKL
ncbi:hypothetical protein SAMN05421676_11226 [Salinibacillus kushneri]|uniref:Uncharacterized protein n=1 Tax=Salinibacillus kushneri TaxID=237682 RepID=A0A1I0IG20_9BACI|nr:hypothetical protein [Salinibacillus kushneri]SET95004.1 hypothetical protein SAMN05421676_11226 [Salinibacillus kushneri]